MTVSRFIMMKNVIFVGYIAVYDIKQKFQDIVL